MVRMVVLLGIMIVIFFMLFSAGRLAKKTGKFFVVLALLLIGGIWALQPMLSSIKEPAVPAVDTESIQKETEDIEHLWDARFFEKSSLKYNNDLALSAAIMCEQAGSESDQKIRYLLQQIYGFSEEKMESYNYGGDSAFIIAQDSLEIDGKDTVIFVIIARATITWGETVGDWLKGKRQNFLGQKVYGNVYEFEEEIWKGIQDYLHLHKEVEQAENLKILITGHSLGGAVAGMVAARFNSGTGADEWWSDKISKKDIYAYTYGGIKVLTNEKNQKKGFENIHNIYNEYDAYGPKGSKSIWRASSPNAKFGHTDKIYMDIENSKKTDINHWMSTYISAIKQNSVDTSSCRH